MSRPSVTRARRGALAVDSGPSDGQYAQLRWDANTPQERRKASLTVCAGGRDVTERRLFLAMLGLLEGAS